METNQTLEHRFGAADYFYADVEYKDSTLGDCSIQNVEIRYEHGYNKIGFVSPERGYEAPVCCTTVENVI